MDNSSYQNPNGGFETPVEPKKNGNGKIIAIICAVVAILVIAAIVFVISNDRPKVDENSKKGQDAIKALQKKTALSDSDASKLNETFKSNINGTVFQIMDPESNDNFKSASDTMKSAGVKEYSIAANPSNGSSIQFICANHDIISSSMQEIQNQYSLKKESSTADYTKYTGTYSQSFKTIVVKSYNYVIIGMAASDEALSDVNTTIDSLANSLSK